MMIWACSFFWVMIHRASNMTRSSFTPRGDTYRLTSMPANSNYLLFCSILAQQPLCTYSTNMFMAEVTKVWLVPAEASRKVAIGKYRLLLSMSNVHREAIFVPPGIGPSNNMGQEAYSTFLPGLVPRRCQEALGVVRTSKFPARAKCGPCIGLDLETAGAATSFT